MTWSCTLQFTGTITVLWVAANNQDSGTLSTMAHIISMHGMHACSVHTDEGVFRNTLYGWSDTNDVASAWQLGRWEDFCT